MSLLTVGITSYNHGKYIGKTIESILNQSFQDFELIIVDDASKDNSIEIIKSFHDKRIKLIELKINNGVCKASNICINNANGKYLSLIASDDIMMPGKLEKQVKFLEENDDYGAIFGGLEVINEKGKIQIKKTKKLEKYFSNQNYSREEWLNIFFFKGNSIAAPSMMVRTAIIKNLNGYDLRLSQAQDFDMWVRILLTGYNIYVLPEKITQYRRIKNNANLSSNTSIMRKRLIFDNEKILNNYLKIKTTNELVKIFPNLSEIKHKITPELIPFFVAREAEKNQDSYYHLQFAISVIYNLFENQDNIIYLENYGFSVNHDFYNLVENNPIGNLLEIANKKTFWKRIIKLLNKFFG